MDITALQNAITTIGFPIVVCLLAFYYINKQTEIHKSEVDGLKEEINTLCLSLQKLTDSIGELLRKEGLENENK